MLKCFQTLMIFNPTCLFVRGNFLADDYIQKSTSLSVITFYHTMNIQKLSNSIRSMLPLRLLPQPSPYNPTPYLFTHHFQSIYELYSPQIHAPFERERVFFTDGGHISLDWLGKTQNQTEKSVVVIMHGMTGGSQTKYIRALADKAVQNNYICVCINGRGINSEMTSPIPFVGYDFHQLQSAINRVQIHYPKSQLHVIGTSLGGNFVLRYLLKHKVPNVKSLSLISAPFDVKHAIDNMHPWYQSFFIKSYIENSVCRHEQMKFWWENNIVDLEHLKESRNLRDFHERITTKMTGQDDLDKFFDHFKIRCEDLERFDLDTFIMNAEDDPMVCFKTVPTKTFQKNKKIKFISTKTGGHLCWFEGITSPQRWYPKPVFEFINYVQGGASNKVI